MTHWEYKVIAAPRRGIKVRGAKSTEDRFAAALEDVMNQQGAEGWEYLRSDTLPAEERQGLTGRTTVYQNMLVFRRPVASAAGTLVLNKAEAPAPAPVPPVAPPAPQNLAVPTAATTPTTAPPVGPAEARPAE